MKLFISKYRHFWSLAYSFHMIDLLLIVLSFAFVPIGIILMFIGCFYCFLFIQHCATYSGDEDALSENSTNLRRDGIESTPTPSRISLTIVNEPRSRGGSSVRDVRNSRDPSPGGKRLGGITVPAAPPAVNNSEDLPPPPYHSICFINQDKSDNKDSSTVHISTV